MTYFLIFPEEPASLARSINSLVFQILMSVFMFERMLFKMESVLSGSDQKLRFVSLSFKANITSCWRLALSKSLEENLERA